jgi:signal transduction histidine kinase
VSDLHRTSPLAALFSGARPVRGTGRVLTLVLVLLALMGAVTTMEFVTAPDETFGGLMLLCVVAAIWLLPPWPALLISAVALIQPAVLEITGQWPGLTADFQFIAVAVVTVFGMVAVNALARIGAEREALIESLTRFTAEAAHELNSPLSAIRVAADVTLRHPREPERYVTSLVQIRDQAVRLSVLTEGLLLLARRDARALVLRRTPLSVDDLMEELYDRWREPAQRARVSLEVDRESGVELSGDAVLLGRLFDNLVDNSLRHAKSRISVTTRVGGGTCLVAIEDDGGGFPEGDRPATVEQLRRGDTVPARRGGTGLGLSIALAIATEHGGTINLEHPIGGLRTVVRLPVTAN